VLGICLEDFMNFSLIFVQIASNIVGECTRKPFGKEFVASVLAEIEKRLFGWEAAGRGTNGRVFGATKNA